MTQVSRYGHMLKLTMDKVRMHVTARYKVEGSVLNDTVRADVAGLETRLELESPEPPETIARLVRNAERGYPRVSAPCPGRSPARAGWP
jgi:hypothetical protein